MLTILLTLTWLAGIGNEPIETAAQDAGFVRFPSGESLPITSGPEAEGQEFDDPFDSGNPLLDVSGANASKKLSANFSAVELARSGDKVFSKARIDPDLVRCLQAIRDHVDKPVIVTSGYRSYTYNKEVYRQRGEEATTSRHISGQAVDIKVQGMSGLEIAKAAIDAYGTEIGVGIGSNYAHIDVRGKWARWTYFSGNRNTETIHEIDRYRKQRMER